MMQAADLRNGDHLSDSGRHDRAWVRTIFVERKMRPGSMVVIDIRGQDAAQMALVERSGCDPNIRGESNRSRALHKRSARVSVAP
jgi:hypothetical protein